MPEELVHIHSEDGFRLDGVVVRPFEPARQRPVIVVIPGLYSAFYDPPYVAIARELAARGYPALVGNTRGHDFGAVLTTPDGTPVAGGGGWERLGESPRDVAPWVALAAGIGPGSVALLGHSLGARKAAYYQAQRHDSRIVALIAASPAVGPFPPPEPEITAIAERMVREGNGRDLLPWPAVGCSMSAATYLDHEQPEAAFLHIFAPNVPGGPPPLIALIECPILAFFGSEERRGEAQDRAAELDRLRRHATAAAVVDTRMIEGMDHGYTGSEGAVAGLIVSWLQQQVGLMR